MERSAIKPGEGRKLPKPNNIVHVFPQTKMDFFKNWCIYLRPFINLTNREVDVMASFLKHRWELSQIISDPATLDTVVMSNDTKKKVMEDCKISKEHFYVVMSNLREHHVIQNNIINGKK